MGNRGTIVLLVLFFGGLGALWWARWSGVPTAEERRQRAGRVLPELVALETEYIDRIEIYTNPNLVTRIEGPDGRIVLERQGPGRWRIVEPVEALAEGDRVEVLLNNLKELRQWSEAGEIEGDPAAFGLETPDRVVMLYRNREGEEPPVASLSLGDTLERLRYVKPADGPIALAEASLLEPIDLSAEAWRDRSLFDIYSYDVRALDVRGPGRDLRIELDEGRWRIVEPFRAPADARAVNGTLADLAGLEAIAEGGFVANDVEDLSAFGLDPPQATITLTPAGLTGPAEPRTAFLGKAPEGRDDLRYARREGQDDVLLVRGGAVADLGRDPLAFRSRSVIDVDPAEVAALRIKAGDLEHRLVRDRGLWRVTAPAPGPADVVDVGRLLETLSGLQSATFLTPDQVSDAGLDAPTAVFDLWLSDSDEEDASSRSIEPTDDDPSRMDQPADLSLAIGRYDPGKKLVYGQMAGDEGTILALPETVRAVIPDGPLALRNRTLVRQDPRSIRRIELTRDGQSFAIERAPSGSGWRLVEPTHAPADPMAARMLTEALAMLRADRLVEESPESLAPFGLDDPSIVVSWMAGTGPVEDSASDVESSHTLRVGQLVPERPEERYAMLEDRPEVVTIGPKLLALLTAELRHRTVLAFDPDRVDRLTIRGPVESISFRRSGPETDDEGSAVWVPDGDRSGWPAGYDVARIESLVTALSRLTTDRFIQHDGPMPPGSGLSPPRRVIEVGLQGQDEPIVLRLGYPSNDRHYLAALHENGPGAVFVVPADLFTLPLPRSESESDAEPEPARIPDDPFAQPSNS